MKTNFLEEAIPKFYGSVTMGERGQVVIPIEARKEFGLDPGTKLLVFGNPHGIGLILTRAELATEFLTEAIARLAQFEKVIKTDTELTYKPK